MAMDALKQAFVPERREVEEIPAASDAPAETMPAHAEVKAAASPAQVKTTQLVSPAASPAQAAGATPPPPVIAPAVRLLRAAQTHAFSMVLWTLSLAMLLAVWYLGTRYKVDLYIRFTNIPTPADVLQRLFEVNQSTKFVTNIGISVRRILIGFGIATLIAVPLGLLIGRYRPVRDLLLPACEVLRPIPAIAWVPMSIMLWPNNESSIIYITFLGSFFPILLNTIDGVRSIDSVLIRAAKCLGAKEPALLWNVVLPGALPQIFTGLAVGMGVAWVSLIAAEMISGQFGVGYFTWEAYSLVNYAEIVLGMITIGVLGLICSGFIRGTSRLAMPWMRFSQAGKR